MRKDTIKIPKEVRKEITEYARQLIMEADRQEAEFLFPFIQKKATPKIRGQITIDKLIDRNIKRIFNEFSCEVWYEQDGKIITPVFVRDNKKLLDAFK